jgi:HTH-type transcriptional regulator / antitoxin HipB
MKTYTLNDIQDIFIGALGIPERDKFEYELQINLIGNAIKQAAAKIVRHRNT